MISQSFRKNSSSFSSDARYDVVANIGDLPDSDLCEHSINKLALMILANDKELFHIQNSKEFFVQEIKKIFLPKIDPLQHHNIRTWLISANFYDKIKKKKFDKLITYALALAILSFSRWIVTRTVISTAIIFNTSILMARSFSFWIPFQISSRNVSERFFGFLTT